MMRDLSLMCFFLLWGSATGDGDEGGGGLRTLIVLEELSVRSTHSIFFRYLEERGHTLQYIKAEDLTELSFTSYGEYLYDNMVLFSGGIGSDGGRKEAVMLPEATGAILAFVDGGKNLILAVSPYASEVVREVALDCGVSVDEELGYVQVGDEQVFHAKLELILPSPARMHMQLGACP